MRIRLRHGRFPENGRAILFSDVHGNVEALREVIRIVEPREGDVLFPVGDYLERGKDGLGTLREMMKICREYEVYPVMGNVDAYVLWMFWRSTRYTDRALRFALAAGKGRFAVQARDLLGEKDPFLFPEDVPDLAARINPTEYFIRHTENSPEEARAFDAFREKVWDAFGEELTWLKKLPSIMDTGAMVFVHGGLPRETAAFTEEPSAPTEMTEDEKAPPKAVNWRELAPKHERLAALQGRDIFEVQKNDRFCDQGLCFERWVAVGHWPVFNYRANFPSELPLLDSHRHILSLDGGCSVKSDGGQLNAFIIGDSTEHYPKESRNLAPVPNILGRPTAVVYADVLPKATALDEQEKSAEIPVSVRWGDNAVKILERENGLLLVEHESSGRRLYVPERFIYQEGDPAKGEPTRIRDITDYCPEIHAGDPIRVIAQSDLGTIIKHGGVKGWYHGRFAPEETI